MKKEKNKRTVAWVLLGILITLALTLTYIRFFGISNPNIEEVKNDSSTNAIQIALDDITKNFNNNPLIEKYKEENITIKASVNNHSIYISYITEETITYEFNYSNLKLSITLNDDDEDFSKFKTIYEILISATQERINNKENVKELINMFFEGKEVIGLERIEIENGAEYHLSIIEKLKKVEE